MKLGRPSAIEITPINHGAEFRFRLRSSDNRLAAEFLTSADDIVRLTGALQGLVARHKLSVPKDARTSGKPSLRVVTED